MREVNHIYMVVSNYPEEITEHFKGEQIGRTAFTRWIATRLPPPLNPRTGLLEDFDHCNIVKENIDEMYKPLFKRKQGRWLLDAMKREDTLVFFTPSYAGCDAKDLGVILDHCYRNDITVAFASSTHRFFYWDLPSNFISKDSFIQLLQDIGTAAYKFRCIRSKATHYHSRKHKLCCGPTPIGFKKNRFNKMIPDWDSHVLLRLIVYLRQIHDMKWTEISQRLAELYNKPGRHYPTASRAKIPWSPQMCVKGYRAWKKIRAT